MADGTNFEQYREALSTVETMERALHVVEFHPSDWGSSAYISAVVDVGNPGKLVASIICGPNTDYPGLPLVTWGDIEISGLEHHLKSYLSNDEEFRALAGEFSGFERPFGDFLKSVQQNIESWDLEKYDEMLATIEAAGLLGFSILTECDV